MTHLENPFRIHIIVAHKLGKETKEYPLTKIHGDLISE